jgi:hypothetical protein
MSETYFNIIPDELVLIILGTLKSMKEFDTLLSILHPRFNSKNYLINLIYQVWPYEISNTFLNSEEITIKEIKYLIGLLISGEWKLLKNNVSDDVLYSNFISVEKLKYILDLVSRYNNKDSRCNSKNPKEIRKNIHTYNLITLINTTKSLGIRDLGISEYSTSRRQSLIDLIINFLDEYGLGLK